MAGMYRDVAYVRGQCCHLARQLANIAAAKDEPA